MQHESRQPAQDAGEARGPGSPGGTLSRSGPADVLRCWRGRGFGIAAGLFPLRRYLRIIQPMPDGPWLSSGHRGRVDGGRHRPRPPEGGKVLESIITPRTLPPRLLFFV